MLPRTSRKNWLSLRLPLRAATFRVLNYFVTFTSPLLDEKFVEGLKPVLDEEGEDQIRYEVKPGRFRRRFVLNKTAAYEKITKLFICH